MALTDTLIPSASSDAVAVFGANLSQVFSGARPIKAAVTEDSKLMEHPLETGAVVTDHRIVLPIEIELSLILTATYRNVYQQIKQLFTDGTLLTVQTRTASYSNMVIMSLPHDEDPEMFDAIAIAVKLRQVEIISPQYGTLPPSKVANKSQASTVKKGQQQGKDSTDPKITSAAASIFGVSR